MTVWPCSVLVLLLGSRGGTSCAAGSPFGVKGRLLDDCVAVFGFGVAARVAGVCRAFRSV
ncbi:hypothetical protein ATK36_2565 [Amycolatopsis sulphurea]|uniref:Uncharacterized protein n=1 Tax=Amycolatopsis sulphurea TaxID=76022 RepID=A0A2A9FAJ5_9PSEU|nr:hypothetical protein ATK36_2565 [Amycolatopsis sulphurea]